MGAVRFFGIIREYAREGDGADYALALFFRDLPSATDAEIELRAAGACDSLVFALDTGGGLVMRPELSAVAKLTPKGFPAPLVAFLDREKLDAFLKLAASEGWIRTVDHADVYDAETETSDLGTLGTTFYARTDLSDVFEGRLTVSPSEQVPISFAPVAETPAAPPTHRPSVRAPRDAPVTMTAPASPQKAAKASKAPKAATPTPERVVTLIRCTFRF